MRRTKTLLALLLLLSPGLAWAQTTTRTFPELYLSLTGGTVTGPITLTDGSKTAPALVFPSGAWMYGSGNTVLIGTASTPRIQLGVSQLFSSVSLLRWGDNGDVALATPDLILGRDAANTLYQKNGNADQLQRTYGTNGGYWERGSASETITIAAAATTDSTANLLPANAVIEGVTIYVQTIIPTAATFTVGDATVAARFATGVAVAAGTSATGLLHRNPADADNAGPVQTAAAKVRITPNLAPGAATGVVRVIIFFSRFVAPTT